MATLFLFDGRRRSFTIEELQEDAQLPFVGGLRVSAADLTRGARSNVFWTDRLALQALDALAGRSGISFQVCGGFRRIKSASFPLCAPQYAGLAFHLRLPSPALACRLAAKARQSAAFPLISPPFVTGCEVRVSFPCRACFALGDAGADVLAFQDALLLAGFSGVSLTGIIDTATQRAVRQLQLLTGLPATGVPNRVEILQLARLTSAYQRAKMRGRIILGTEGLHGL